jgi:Ca-activated chloride channel family protein
MAVRVERSVARVRRADGRDWAGLAFTLDRRHVVTCAHVVNAALGEVADDVTRPNGDVQLLVDFRLGGTQQRHDMPVRYGKVVVWLPSAFHPFDRRDVAILELGEDLPMSVAVPRLDLDPGDDVVRMFGPGAESQGHLVEVHGTLRGEVEPDLLQADEHLADVFRTSSGFSGGPVWLPGSGGVVGMLRAATAPGPRPSEANVVAADLIAGAYRWVPGGPVGEVVRGPRRAERARRWAVHPWAACVSAACGLAGFVLYQGAGFGLYHALRFVPFLPQIDPVGTLDAALVAAGVGGSVHVTGVLLGLTSPTSPTTPTGKGTDAVRGVREVRWLLVGQALVAFVALVVVVPRLVDCVSVEVASSGEMGKVAALQAIARDYNRADHRLGSRCIEVSVHSTNSGIAMAGLRDGWSTSEDIDAPEPQVWMPSSSMWLELLRESGRVPRLPDPDDATSVASSNLVVAMPEPMARALGWPRRQFTWREVLALAEDGWDDELAGEWGAFSFVKDDIDRSTTGLGATVAAYYAAADGNDADGDAAAGQGRRRALQVTDIDDPDVTRFVQGVEAGVHYYVDDTIEYLRNLAAHDTADPDFNDPFVSAVVVEEQLLYEYNTGAYDVAGDETPPHTRLVALYPTDGLLTLDHPYVVLPSGSDSQQQAAADFLDHLQQPGPQRRLTAVGFRDPDGRLALPDGGADVGLVPAADRTEQVPQPSGEVLQEMLDTYSDIRKPARILLLVDTSGSMGATLTGDGRTRFEVVQEALDQGLGHLPGEDEIGLWAFPDPGGDGSHQELVPMGRFDADQRQRIVDGVADLPADDKGRDCDGTPLYRAIQAAYADLLDKGDTDTINAVIVLTDGEDHDRSDRPLSLERLVAQVDAESAGSGPERRPSVTVFSIALPGASFPALDAISDSANGEAFTADDPGALADAFTSVFSRL